MAEMKKWAYRHEEGAEWTTADAHWRERYDKFGGQPSRDAFFSTHKPPGRKRMKHIHKGGISYFSYVNASDESGGDGGESLTHRLFKDAIASISKTELRLGKLGEYPIVVTHGETEKRVDAVDGRYYYVDVYLRFESTSLLGMKWSGEVYVEVHNTNAVHAQKMQDLRQLRLPVIEVPVMDLFVYPHTEYETTDWREAEHLKNSRRILEGGYLIGTAINNPNSVEYLELQLERTRRELAEAQQQAAIKGKLMIDAKQSEATLRAEFEEINRKNRDAGERLKTFEQKTVRWEKETQSLKSTIATEQAEYVELQKLLRYVSVVLGIPTIGLIGYFLYQLYRIIANWLGG